jgi:hypothetical protein
MKESSGGGWIQVWYIWYTVRTFVSDTMYPPPNTTMTIKKKTLLPRVLIPQPPCSQLQGVLVWLLIIHFIKLLHFHTDYIPRIPTLLFLHTNTHKLIPCDMNHILYFVFNDFYDFKLFYLKRIKSSSPEQYFVYIWIPLIFS